MKKLFIILALFMFHACYNDTNSTVDNISTIGWIEKLPICSTHDTRCNTETNMAEYCSLYEWKEIEGGWPLHLLTCKEYFTE